MRILALHVFAVRPQENGNNWWSNIFTEVASNYFNGLGVAVLFGK
jgi:hypothetical protein|tara:strand:- start:218 stop:352 length:135 start_codon:yes stop_codon:yes gene_type:complete